MLHRGTWEDGQQPSNQLGSNDTVNHITAIFLMIHISNAIQDKFIRGTTYDFANASHQFRDERPGERRYQGAKQSAAPSQARSGDAGHKALLFHNAQDALASFRIHIRLLIEHARNRTRGYACQPCDIHDRQLFGHSKPSQWAFLRKKASEKINRNRSRYRYRNRLRLVYLINCAIVNRFWSDLQAL